MLTRLARLITQSQQLGLMRGLDGLIDVRRLLFISDVCCDDRNYGLVHG
jgi:hypothetical protein